MDTLPYQVINVRNHHKNIIILTKSPTTQKKRIEILDVYRGFAIMGIFVVNIVIMNSTFLNQDEFAKQWTATIDQVAERVLQLFFYTKFFPIFSLLFGLGISMQAIKMAESHTLSFTFYARRMLILFVLGILHIVFIWSGDVLHLYAILGLLVTLMIKKSNTFLLGLSLFFLLFPFYDQLFSSIFEWLSYHPEKYLSNYTGKDVNTIIKYGTYLVGIQLRIREYFSNLPMLLGFLAPMALSMFLLGLYLGKNKVYESLDLFIHKIKKPLLITAVVTNIYRIVFLFVLPNTAVYRIDIYRSIFIKFMVVSDITMGICYLWIIGWLWYHTKWSYILTPLKYAGRMALTNYILQSIIGLFIFSSIGFGCYETFSPSGTLCIALLVFAFQIVLSRIWLSYFTFGPLEWAWRCLTYKKYLPIKKV